jgi:hypothetical protein
VPEFVRDSDDGGTAMRTTYKFGRIERTTLDRELETNASTYEYRTEYHSSVGFGANCQAG